MHPTPARLAAITLAAAFALPLLAAPAAAQDRDLRTFAQMQRQFPTLAPRHIEICDRNGDGLYDRGEQACVASMNSALRQGR